MINFSRNEVPKRVLITCGSTLIISVLLCLWTYHLLVRKCTWWNCAPTREFSIYDLNLPRDFFPPGAQITQLQPDRSPVAVDEASTTNYWERGRAVYSVFQFSTVEAANAWFAKEVNSFEFTNEIEDLAPFQQILRYESKFADEHAVFCGYVASDVQCNFAARYQEFYVFFSGSIGEGEMSADSFIAVMNFVDAKMEELLSRSDP